MMRKDQEAGTDEHIEPNEGAEVARRLAKQWLTEGTELIPLSHLVLDHPEPIAGWEPLLQAHGIELLEDDLYRPAIRREDARRLVTERREWERENEKARRLQESLEVPPFPPASRPCRTARRWRRSWLTIPATRRRRPSSGARSRTSWTSCSRKGSGTRPTFKRRPRPTKAARDR